MMLKVFTGVACVLALAACSSLNDVVDMETTIDYKSTVVGEPLALPPGLSDSQIQPIYRFPNSTASVVTLSQQDSSNASVRTKSTQSATSHTMKIERRGQERVLLVQMSEEKLFEKIAVFWRQNGFTIQSEDPATGLVVTDWAENRAGIKAGLIQRALGSVGRALADSGLRDRFTTRLDVEGKYLVVHISHERMQEVPSSRDGTRFKWVVAKEDPNLNALMLGKFMVYLGADQKVATEALKQTTVSKSYTEVVGDQLTIRDRLPQAYERLGRALRRAGFTVEKADPDHRLYVIRYLDTDSGKKRKDPKALARLLGERSTVEPIAYTLKMIAQGQEETRVSISADYENSYTTKRRILTVIAEKLGD